MKSRETRDRACAIRYGQRLLDATIDLVGGAKVDLDEGWARRIHAVALTILCHTISNLPAWLRLAQERQGNGGALARSLDDENVLWLNMVKLRGSRVRSGGD